MTGVDENIFAGRGRVVSIFFRKPEDFFFIFKLKTSDEIITISGTSHLLKVGDQIEVEGRWTTHPKYGKQVRAKNIINKTMDNIFDQTLVTEKSLIVFLNESLKVPGIGEATIKKLVKEFGKSTLDVIENTPMDLLKIPSLNEKKILALQEMLLENIQMSKMLVALGSFDITPKLASKILFFFQAKKITGYELILDIIKGNPYMLCEVPGIGFSRADAYAKAIGFDVSSTFRISAGMKYALSEAVFLEGSCGISKEDLFKVSSEMLGLPLANHRQLFVDVLTLLVEKQEVQVENDFCYDLSVFRAENGVAEHVLRLLSAPKEASVDEMVLNQAIGKAEKTCGVTLSNLQRDAVLLSVQSPISIITGQPGTGKTTILKVLLETIKNIEAGRKVKVSLCAPTGKAAKRMKETCNVDAKTIHRLLEIGKDGRFVKGLHNKLKIDFLACDEFSMMDVFLTNDLFSAIATGTRVVLLGDVNQLPSIGPGKVLNDLIESKRIPVSVLTEIRRQGEGSAIVLAAKQVLGGVFPAQPPGQDDFVICLNSDPQLEVVSQVKALLAKGVASSDIQILCPQKTSKVGVEELNKVLQPLLNTAFKSGQNTIKRFDVEFGVGDRVMQVKNDYENDVFNGDVGFIEKIEDNQVWVRFDSPSQVMYTSQDLENIVLAYAITIHKSQGSEMPYVILPVSNANHFMLKRSLLYTGMTRAKKKLFIVTEPSRSWGMNPAAIMRAISTVEISKRVTRLLFLMGGNQ